MEYPGLPRGVEYKHTTLKTGEGRSQKESKGNVIMEAAQTQCCWLQNWRKEVKSDARGLWKLSSPAEDSVPCMADFAALASNFVV